MAINNNLPILCLFLITLLSIHLHQVYSIVTPTRSKHPKSDMKEEFLIGHNAVRYEYKLPYLKWSKHLADFAKFYANERRGDCALLDSPGGLFGENLFSGQGKRWKPTDAVVAWKGEEQYYNYENNTCESGKACRHYTQLVWRSTTMVGCAQSKCNNGGTFIVCEYFPPGNRASERPY